MNDPREALSGDAIQAGLLMEGAQAQQRLAEVQLQSLRAHTEGLDGVVRDEIRRTLVEEFHALECESRRAATALDRLRRSVAMRWTFVALLSMAVCAVAPATLERWTAPSAADLAGLRQRRDALMANLEQLRRAGAAAEWHHCGEAQRLCVRVDAKAPVYGTSADFYVVKGY